jgi:Raf kinase inhibitor-like YbhB/YbcL family protein
MSARDDVSPRLQNRTALDLSDILREVTKRISAMETGRTLTALAILLASITGLIVAQELNELAGGAAMAFTVKSPAFSPGAEIPKQFTCSGADVSPALEWSGAPAKTASFALIMDDPDAPVGTWVHWALWNLPASTRSLPQGVAKREQLEDGSQQGANDFRKIGYNGPCPPPGKPHRYFFRLYALDAKLSLASGATRQELDAAMKGHVVGQAEYMGTFRR